MFLSIASILCIQVSLWIYIMIIIGHLEILYMRKLISFLDIIYSLSATLFVSFYSLGGFGKRLCHECLYVLHIILCTHDLVLSCVLNLFWTDTWHDDHIGYSYFILSKICSLHLLNVFLPCLILFSYHTILLHSIDPIYGLSSSIFHHWICAFDFTHLFLRYAHIKEELILY